MSEYPHRIEDTEIHEVSNELVDDVVVEHQDDPTDPADTHVEGVDRP